MQLKGDLYLIDLTLLQLLSFNNFAFAYLAGSAGVLFTKTKYQEKSGSDLFCQHQMSVGEAEETKVMGYGRMHMNDWSYF